MKTKRKKSSGHRMTEEEVILRKKANTVLQKLILAMKKDRAVVDIRMIWQVDICKILEEIDKQIKKNLSVLDYEIQLDCNNSLAQLVIKNPQECFIELSKKPLKKTPEQLRAEWRECKKKQSDKKKLRKKVMIKTNYW